jgi:DnaD/phage-associated family protein
LDKLSLPIKFIDEYLPKADPAYVVVYLYVYRFISNDESVPDTSQIAFTLGMKESDVVDAFKYWNNLGFNLGSKTIVKTLHKSIYTPSEIAEHARNDKKLRWLYEEAQNALGKILSSADMLTLFWIYDYLCLNPQIIILIINFAKKNGKETMRYVEKVAMDWAEKGIDTVRKAEKHLALLEEKNSYENKIKSIFGIRDRDLTPSEKNMVEQWRSELNLPEELLAEAFEINIKRTGKLNLRYINGILKSWKEKGISTVTQLEKNDKKTAFSNFDQREDIDFEAREIQMLKKRIGR